MTLEVYFIICTLSIFQILILFLIVRLHSNWRNRTTKYFLIFLISNALLLTLSAIYSKFDLTLSLSLIFSLLSTSLFLLLGPMLYFFMIRIFDFEHILDHKKYHFILPISALCVSALSFIYESNAEGNPEYGGSIFLYKFLMVTAIIQLLIYVILSFRVFYRYKNLLVHRSSNIDERSIRWLNILLIVYLIHWSFEALTVFLDIGGLINLSQSIGLGIISIFSLLAFLTLTVIRGVQDFGIVRIRVHSEKYSNSSLTEDKKTGLKEKLQQYMELNEPYRNPNLTINELAGSLNLPVKTISQVINEGFDCNFFDFINRYRIELAKRLLVENVADNQKPLTIQQIFYDVGFNTKSAFNRAFKKNTGLTPTAFRAKNN